MISMFFATIVFCSSVAGRAISIGYPCLSVSQASLVLSQDEESAMIVGQIQSMVAALGMQLSGSLELEDIVKLMAKGTKFDVDMVEQDNGFLSIDFDTKEGKGMHLATGAVRTVMSNR